MLYERWRAIASERRHEFALLDFGSGQRWTFGQLQAQAESHPLKADVVVHPQGNSPGFLFDVLATWRAGRVVCPLESGQPAPAIPAPPAACIHLKTTSATTGSARLVAFTAAQLLADAENIVATMGLRPDWPNLGVISLAHSYGFSNLALPLLLHGIPLILVPSPLPETIRRTVEKESTITLAAVPAMWRAWHEARVINQSFRLAISAGAPLPLRLEQAVFADCAVKIHNFYGSTECGGIAYDLSDAPRNEDNYAGSPMRGVNLSVSDDNCLIVQSGAVGETYLPTPNSTLAAGKFQTSDLAELRSNGVYLRGRLSDQINVAGRKVSPDTIEGVLRDHPQVRDCLVFGAPSRDRERTDSIVAVVATSATESELKHFLQQKLPAWQLPREWRFVDSLSTNERGKISREEWRKTYLKPAD